MQIPTTSPHYSAKNKIDISRGTRDKYTIRAALKHPDQVAAIAKERYLQKYGVKLKISNSSLTNEIMYHAVAYKLHILMDHSKTAECGEGNIFKKSGDTNRWFWDFFSGRN